MQLSHSEIRDLVRNQIQTMSGKSYPYITEVYPDKVIYELDEKYFQRDYAIVDGKVTVGDAVSVEKKINYLPIPMQAASTLLAAVGKKDSEDYGYTWKVQIVEYGLGTDGRINWPAEPLKAAMPLYEGSRVFALIESQHMDKPKRFGKSVREIVGWMENIVDTGTGLEGDFQILKSSKWLRDMVVDSFDRGKEDLIGFSHDVKALSKTVRLRGAKVKEPTKIIGVEIDVVHSPTNNGKFINMVAAEEVHQNIKEGNIMQLEQLLAALKQVNPKAYDGLQPKITDGSVTAEEVLVLMAAGGGPSDEALKAAVAAHLKDAEERDVTINVATKTSADDGSALSIQAATKVLDEAKVLVAGVTLEREVAASQLPDLSKTRITKMFAGKVFELGDLQSGIKDEKEFLDNLSASGAISGAGDVRVTKDSRDNAILMIDDFFEGKVSSIKAAYVNLTGDTLVTGHMKAAIRLTASVDSTTFAEILGDSVTRRMIAEYKMSNLQDWRKIVNIVPLNDFRTNHRTRMGGYGDLPTVDEGEPYGALATPGDEEATYAAMKKGGTEDLTLEMIKNDDAGAVQAIPRKLARAATRTLYKFVFNTLLADNPTIYDAVALFHASHGNLGAVGLDATNLALRRQAMLKQTEADSGERLGIPAKYLIHPVDLDKVAYDLVAAPRNSDFDPTAADFTRTLQMETISVPIWTDVNNWFLMADPMDIASIEIGFLDGKEDPELFVQDAPNVGSMFSNDKLTYKIRHVYGGANTDYRGADGSIVT